MTAVGRKAKTYLQIKIHMKRMCLHIVSLVVGISYMSGLCLSLKPMLLAGQCAIDEVMVK